VVARYSDFRVDAGAFDGFADAKTSARRARAAGFGVTWHLLRRVKALVNVERTWFDGGAGTGDRNAELLIGSRLQVAF
jgi:hypothetical protein